MVFDFRTALPTLVPKAISWAEAHHAHIVQVGQPLNDTLIGVAKKVGVLHPERIRVAELPSLPLPEDIELRQAALDAGLLGPGMAGLTLGYGVFVCSGHSNIRLLSHEFRHVHQFEQAGSMAAFLSVYLQQVATFGYYNAPFEIDARTHELLIV